MKPAPFSYERPRDLPAALALLADPSAKVIAGGQSLGPMLNLRLAQPTLLVDIAGLDELREVTDGADELAIGACVTHADIEDGRLPDRTGGAMRHVAGGIAYRAVRNRGTIGGSLAHADPAADWLSALAALGATVEIASAAGRRHVAVSRFVVGALETSLAAGEIVVSVRVPRLSGAARWGYLKTARKAGEFAHAIGAVLVDLERGVARAVVGALDAPPLVIEDAGDLLGPDHGAFDRPVADAALAAAGVEDALARHVHVVVLERAAKAALS